MDFKTKQYDDFWDYDDSPFKDYGDNENFWIKLTYLIERDYFVPEMGKILSDITAANGLKIFRGKSNLDFSKYTLIDYSKEFANSLKSIYRVTEIYGYAPDRVYTEYDRVNFTIPGYERENAGEFVGLNGYSYDKRNGFITLPLDNSDGKFELGDLVRLEKAPAMISGSLSYALSSDLTEVVTVNNDSISIRDTACNGVDEDGSPFSIPSLVTPPSGESGTFFNMPGAKTITRVLSTRERDWRYTSTAEKRIRYIDVTKTVPQFGTPFFVRLGGQTYLTSDTILTKYTEPRVDEYLSKIGTDERLLVRQESMERYRGVIWKQEAYYLPYK